MNTLSQPQFDILCALALSKDTPLSQRLIAASTHRAIGTVNTIHAELDALGLVRERHITPAGLEALEPYRVRRAVFLAAGFGSRMIPLTLNTPKPLIRVHGTRLIDTLLDAVIAAGITDITIVRGYLAEQFDQLLSKYPMIRFIDNTMYNTSNNISSAYCARHLLRGAYVLESDLLLKNPAIITPWQYHSNYLGIPVEKSNDWCFETGPRKRITKCGVGGENCYQMVGISYWDEVDGARMETSIETVFNMPGGRERYWDQVALDQYISDYDIQVRPCSFDDVIELDTFAELQAVDSVYNV